MLWDSCGVFSLRWDTGSLASNLAAFPHRWGRSKSCGQLLVVWGRTSSRPRVAMPGRFELGDKVTCVRNNNALGKRHAGTISKVTEGARDHGSNHHGDFAVCLYCLLDALTCGALKPDAMWYYSIKYDDGEEEHRVGPARIFPDK